MSEPDVLYNTTTVAWREGEIDDVEAVRRLEARASDPRVRRWLAELHLERGDASSALRELRAAFADPAVAADPDARQALADAERAVVASDGLDTRRLVEFTGGRTLATMTIAVSNEVGLVATGHWNGEVGHPGYGTVLLSEEPILHVWELATGRHVRALGGRGEYASITALVADELFLVATRCTVGAGYKETSVREAWELATGRPVPLAMTGVLATAPRPTPRRKGMFLAQLGELELIVNTDDGTARLVAGARCVRTFEAPRGWHDRSPSVADYPSYAFVAAAPVGDGRTAVVATRETIELWQMPHRVSARPLAPRG
jgi:hypothetical protein